MTVSVFWRFQVKNFDTWLNPDAEGLAQMFKDQGVLAYSLHRSSEDPNAVMVHMEFADENTLSAFDAWYAAAKPEWEIANPGGKHDIVMSWIGKDVEGYCRTL